MTFEETLRALLQEQLAPIREQLAALRRERQGAGELSGSGGERMLTVKEVAERCKLTEPTVRDLIKSGELKAGTFGREYRVRQADFDAFCRRRCAGLEVAEPVDQEAEVSRILATIGHGHTGRQ